MARPPTPRAGPAASAAGPPRALPHRPVLLAEVLAALAPAPGMTVVDCTVGLGGHAIELARRIAPGGRFVGIDLDPAHIAATRAALERLAAELTVGADAAAPPPFAFSLHHTNFAGLPGVLAAAGVDTVDALLADVGVASPQIDDPARGFSYRRPGPLDMRMDPTRGRPAWEVLERMGEAEIAAALLELGDETDAPAIARLIVERRAHAPIRTTEALTRIVCDARDFTLLRAAGAKLHPAARTFQALRILVNRELANLERLLAVLPDGLRRGGGTAAIISFHSGEDRRVKQAFRDGARAGIYAAAAPDAITASALEAGSNPRARSAKLRWARRA